MTDVRFDPQVGFFVIDRLAVGGAIGVGWSRTEANSEPFTTTTFSAEPTIRYYFNGRASARVFGQGSLRYSYHTFHTSFFGSDSARGTGGAVGMGVDFFLNDHVAIEGTLAYDRLKMKSSPDTTGTLGVRFGVSAFVGG